MSPSLRLPRGKGKLLARNRIRQWAFCSTSWRNHGSDKAADRQLSFLLFSDANDDKNLQLFAMRAEDEFTLPVFDRPMDESEPPMSYEQTVDAFEEIIQALRLRESEPLRTEFIEPFEM